jgi:exodeoxyribonuclease-3
MLSRRPIVDVTRGFPGDPLPDQARVVAATVDGIRVINVYVVNGRAVGTPDYERKLRWLDALLEWVRSEHDPREPMLIAGDFNITPEDRDVHDPERWRGQNLCSEPTRAPALAPDMGPVDLLRLHEPPTVY